MESNFPYRIRLDPPGRASPDSPLPAEPPLAISGRNFALVDRFTESRNLPDAPDSVRNKFSSFCAERHYYCSSPRPAPNRELPDGAARSAKKKPKSKRAPVPRTSFTLPVHCLPGGVLQAPREARPRPRPPAPAPAPAAPRPRRASRPCHVRPVHLENRTLIRIREAEQVADFQRILSSNAILCGAARSLAPRFPEMLCDAPLTHSRPLSSYSVWSINEKYNYLYQRHLDSLRSVCDRQFSVETGALNRSNLGTDPEDPVKLPGVNEKVLFEELYNLPEYYESSDLPVQEPVDDTPSDVSDVSINSVNNFNVNLSDLISAGNKNESVAIGVNDEVTDPSQQHIGDSSGQGTSMSTINEVSTPSRLCTGRDIGELEDSLGELQLQPGTVPRITLSECRERSLPAEPHRPAALNLAVPAVECGVEARPPQAE